jgi:chaperonin GroES
MKMNIATNAMQPQAIDPFTARIRSIAEAPNLALQMDEDTLSRLAMLVLDGFDLDVKSMAVWSEKMDRALDLAMLTKEEKTYPWSNAANIRYPLITSAALQYNARAYPAIVPSTDIVKVSVQGRDDGTKAARGGRVARFMTWQLTVDAREWERGTDQLTLQLPIVGDLFRKLWWDVSTNRLRSQIRLPGRHVVVNNNATTIGVAPRISDRIDLYPHQVQTNFRTERFKEITLPPRQKEDQDPEQFIEQLCRHDLDGDGYDEPYIVTVHKEARAVVRVVAAYSMDSIRILEGKIVAAEIEPYMVHYQFMPSMDGGLFGTGMGLLLGDISETINGTLNMIMDSGHLSSLGGGFIGAQNFRIKGGAQRIRPGEYRHVNFTGDDVRKGIVAMEFPGPSPVLFQVLGMMIEAGREITSVSNVMTGDMGRQNMPVGTVMALIEQGQMVFTASYKRIYRALQDEFELIARLNRKNVTPQRYQAMLDEQADPAADFDLSNMDIVPIADPKAVTSMQKMGRAQFLLELAKEGMVDPQEAIARVLDAASIEDIEALMPKPDPRQEQMFALQDELAVLDVRIRDAQLDNTIADTQMKLAKAEKDSAEVDLLPMKARIEEMKQMKEILNARRGEIESRNAGRMAGKPGNGSASGGSAQRRGVQ